MKKTSLKNLHLSVQSGKKEWKEEERRLFYK